MFTLEKNTTMSMQKRAWQGQQLNREQMRRIIGGDESIDGGDAGVICTRCQIDENCAWNKICTESGSCPLDGKVCVLKTRRDC
jgi:hypothetical protein